MNKNKHTPGPWNILKGHTGNYWFVVYKTLETRQRAQAANVYKKFSLVKSGDVEAPAIASIDPSSLNHRQNKDMNDAEALANARLIAAAPDLLEACKLMRTFFEAHGYPIAASKYPSIIAAVIAKAECIDE